MREGSDTAQGCRSDEARLSGKRICLVFEHSLSHYTRLLMEIEALQDAGATVHWLTSFDGDEHPPRGVSRTIAPLKSTVVASELGWRPARISQNISRIIRARTATRIWPSWPARHRIAALSAIAPEVDLFWVIDYPSLQTVLDATARTDARVLYETVDLVPEYPYFGEEHRRASIEGERAAVGVVDGFVTACDSYADYYVELYGDSTLKERPVVRDNMPEHIVARPRPSAHPRRLLFLGSLMTDRPIQELLEAMRLTSHEVTLTLQGKNYLGSAPATLVHELGLEDRVRILDPCSPGDIVATASEYDIGLVLLRGEGENERRASTSKLFTFMAAGLAIVGSDLPGIARIVGDSGVGVLAKSPAPADLADAIDAIASMADDDLNAMRVRSVRTANAYSWERQRPGFIAEFAKAVSATTPG